MPPRTKPAETIHPDDVFPPQEATGQGAVINHPGFPAAPSPEEDVAADLALMQTLAQLGETDPEAKVYIYRVRKGQKDAYLKETTPNDFAQGGLEELRQEYGGGDYRVRVYKNGRVCANQVVSLEDVRKPEIRETQADFTPILQTMNQGFEKLGQMMLQLAQLSQPKQEDRKEMLQEMILLKQLFSNEQKPAVDPSSMFETFMKGLELGKEISPNKPETTENDLMLEMFRGIAGAAVHMPQQPAGMMQQNVAPTVPHIPQQIQQQVSPQPVAQPQGEEMNVQAIMIKQAVNFLVSQAERNNDPFTYANMVLDQMPEDSLNQILNDPNWLQSLAAFNAKVLQHQGWFNELRSNIVQLMNEDAAMGLTGEQTPVQNGDNTGSASPNNNAP